MGKSQSKLSRAQLSDLQGRTRFDGEELQRMYKVFLNNCPSRKLDKPGLRQVYGELFPRGDSGELSDYMFNVFDEDKNGTIDFQEFISSLSILSRGELDQKLRLVFQLYDINGDKTITHDELLQVVRSMFKVGSGVELQADQDTPEKFVDKIFRDMDHDKDTRLTYEEFVEGSKRDPVIVRALTGTG